MHIDVFFDHYFNFLGAKIKINKSVLNLINLDGVEAVVVVPVNITLLQYLRHILRNQGYSF